MTVTLAVKSMIDLKMCVTLCASLLAGYATNGSQVNKCLIALLRRIAHPIDGLNLEPMLYQVHLGPLPIASGTALFSVLCDNCVPSHVLSVQVSVMQVFEGILGDATYRKSAASGGVVWFCRNVVQSLVARLVLPKQRQPTYTDTGSHLCARPGFFDLPVLLQQDGMSASCVLQGRAMARVATAGRRRNPDASAKRKSRWGDGCREVLR